jgi:ribosomal protein L11 methyltransferase
MFLWRKTAEIRWIRAHEELLQAHAQGQLVIVRRPRRKLLQLEIVCSSRKASRRLVADFGGYIEKLPRNWLERFTLDDSKPIKIGKRLIIAKPASNRPGRRYKRPLSRADSGSPARSDALRIAHGTAQIDETQFLLISASIAFGTGDHATTAMSLHLLEELTRHWKPGWSVVDLGTGSGILALAASRFGADPVLGLDNDPAAISTAKSNARLNRIRGATFQLADVRDWKSVQETHVITANLYSGLLIEILPNLRRGGWLVLSGILRGQKTEFVGALRQNKIEIIRIRRRGKWIAILARNRHRGSVRPPQRKTTSRRARVR